MSIQVLMECPENRRQHLAQAASTAKEESMQAKVAAYGPDIAEYAKKENRNVSTYSIACRQTLNNS